MSHRLVLSLLCASLLAPAASAQTGSASPSACAEQFLGHPPMPSLEQLQGFTRRYYPDLAAKATTSSRLVVGFLLDDQCRVLRHSVGILPADYSEDIVQSLFPGATHAGMPSGIGDAVPPDNRRPRLPQSRLVVAWQVQVSPARQAQMARERKRLESLNLFGSR